MKMKKMLKLTELNKREMSRIIGGIGAHTPCSCKCSCICSSNETTASESADIGGSAANSGANVKAS